MRHSWIHLRVFLLQYDPRASGIVGRVHYGAPSGMPEPGGSRSSSHNDPTRIHLTLSVLSPWYSVEVSILACAPSPYVHRQRWQKACSPLRIIY